MVQTVAGSYNKLKEASEILEKEELTMENGRKQHKTSMLDIYHAKVYEAEKNVIKASKQFLHYLNEAGIGFWYTLKIYDGRIF